MEHSNEFDKKLLITEVPNQDKEFDLDDDSDLDSDLSEEAEGDASD